MKRLALAALVLLGSLSALAVEPKPALYVIHEEVANPSMIPQYEAATRDLVKAIADKKTDDPAFRFNTFMTGDMHYVYVLPIANYGAMDAMNTAWMNAAQTFGAERWGDIMRRNASAITSYNEFVVMSRPDLSYMPDNARVKLNEAPYIRWQFYYLRPGTEEQAAQIAKDYASLFRSKNIADGFMIYMAQTGQDLPLLVAAIPAKSPADFAMADEKNTATLGDPLKALQMRALGISRRVEVREGWARPDLSYMAAAK
jgi:hypothetical protein